MNKTKIETFDSTWNVVTGCLHGCEYCYARGIAKRFGGANDGEESYEGEALWTFKGEETGGIHKIDDPWKWYSDDGMTVRNAPYPYYFDPTFHRYKLNEYEKKSGRNIFVCSMADLFGDWVPDEWIEEVLGVCKKAPQHNYLFLTKNPGKYAALDRQGKLPSDGNMWFGTSVTKPGDPFPYNGKEKHNLFLSIEPLLADFGVGNAAALKDIGWVIIGAETGRRKDKVTPEKSWVDNIVSQCKENNIPVFMKESLKILYGEALLREYPPGLIRG